MVPATTKATIATTIIWSVAVSWAVIVIVIPWSPIWAGTHAINITYGRWIPIAAIPVAIAHAGSINYYDIISYLVHIAAGHWKGRNK